MRKDVPGVFSKTIIISGFFGGKHQAKKVDYLERLGVALKRYRCRLVLLNLGIDAPETRLECLRCPEDITEPYRIGGESFLKEENLSLSILRAATVEAEAHDCPLTVATHRILLCQAWMREALKKFKPDLCVIWHQFNGPHHALRDLCDSMGTPHLFMEYGSLPGTVTFDADGQMGESRVAQCFKEFRELPVTSDDLDMAQRYIDHVREARKTSKSQDSDLDLKPIVDAARDRNRRIIFYAGQNDWASGMLPKPFKEARIHSPIYDDTLHALNHLSQMAEANNWQILFKPHPLVEQRHIHFQADYPDRTSLVRGANIFECIALSEITTTILSQVPYLALIHDRPAVLLGCTKLWHKQCTYQPALSVLRRYEENIEPSFLEALEKGYTEDQRRRFVKHVAQLCLYNHHAQDPEVERIVGRGPDVTAHSLHSFIRQKDRDAGFPFKADLDRKTAKAGLGSRFPLLLKIRHHLSAVKKR